MKKSKLLLLVTLAIVMLSSAASAVYQYNFKSTKDFNLDTENKFPEILHVSSKYLKIKSNLPQKLEVKLKTIEGDSSFDFYRQYFISDQYDLIIKEVKDTTIVLCNFNYEFYGGTININIYAPQLVKLYISNSIVFVENKNAIQHNIKNEAFKEFNNKVNAVLYDESAIRVNEFDTLVADVYNFSLVEIEQSSYAKFGQSIAKGGVVNLKLFNNSILQSNNIDCKALMTNIKLQDNAFIEDNEKRISLKGTKYKREVNPNN